VSSCGRTGTQQQRQCQTTTQNLHLGLPTPGGGPIGAPLGRQASGLFGGAKQVPDTLPSRPSNEQAASAFKLPQAFRASGGGPMRAGPSPGPGWRGATSAATAVNASTHSAAVAAIFPILASRITLYLML
jgi:hypothetical protein